MDLLSGDLLENFSPTFISTVFATLTLYLRNWYYLDLWSDQVATYLDYSEQFDFIIGTHIFSNILKIFFQVYL